MELEYLVIEISKIRTISNNEFFFDLTNFISKIYHYEK